MSDDSRDPNGRFVRGTPGGPGRPRAYQRIDALDRYVGEAAPDLVDAAIALAKGGNLKAIELLLGRVWPARNGRPIAIAAPEIREPADLLPVGAAMTDAVLSGDLTPEEGTAAARMLLTHEKLYTTVEFERRLRALEDEDDGLARSSNGEPAK